PASEPLPGHPDEALGKERVGVRLLHRERDELALELDVLDGHFGELPRRLGGREGLAEVEEELRELDLREESIGQLATRDALTGDAGGCRGDEGDALAPRRGGGARELWEERGERLVHAIARCGVVIECRLDPRLSLEGDGDALVERQHPAGDRRPTRRRRGSCGSRGRRGSGSRRLSEGERDAATDDGYRENEDCARNIHTARRI